jgi:hypothetical protein
MASEGNASAERKSEQIKDNIIFAPSFNTKQKEHVEL